MSPWQKPTQTFSVGFALSSAPIPPAQETQERGKEPGVLARPPSTLSTLHISQGKGLPLCNEGTSGRGLDLKRGQPVPQKEKPISPRISASLQMPLPHTCPSVSPTGAKQVCLLDQLLAEIGFEWQLAPDRMISRPTG